MADFGCPPRFLQLPFKFGGTDLTFQAWINPQFNYNLGNINPVILGDINGFNDHGIFLGYDGYSSNNDFNFAADYSSQVAYASGPAITTNSALGQNTWQMLVARIASQVPSLWMNGASYATTIQNGSGTFVAMDNNASIGNSLTYISEGVNGQRCQQSALQV